MLINTGHEKYISGDDHDIDIDASIESIQSAMYARNPEKYGNFLETLKSTKLGLSLLLLSNVQTRVELFRCVYYAMRLIDDVVDGDTIPPMPLEERRLLLESIISGDINTIENPLYKALAIRISDLASMLGMEEEMNEAMNQIIQSMKFDLDRIMDNNDKTRTELDLAKNFHSMDIEGTIAGTAIIFGINIESAKSALNDLGEACRIVYNLDDFIEDIRAGLINIGKEAIERHGITQEDLQVVSSEGFSIENLPASIKVWFEAEVWNYNNRMEAHDAGIIQGLKFNDKRDIFLSWWRNMFMKHMVLPKVYIGDNNSRIQRIISQVGIAQ